MAVAQRHAPYGVARLLVAGIFGGAIAGAGAGAIDAFWSWGDLSQFLPSTGGKLRLVVFLAAAYGLAGTIAGPVIFAAARLLWHGTRIGDLARHALSKHRELRAADPRDALAGLSLAIAGIPIVCASLGGSYAVAVRALANRKHMGLVVAAAMAGAVVALVAAVVLSFVVGRAIEVALRALAKNNAGLARTLSAPAAPAIAAAVLGLTCAVVGVVLTRDTLSLLRLRPYVALLVMIAFAFPALRAGHRIAGVLTGWRGSGAIGKVVALAAVVLLAGGSDSVLKAADHYSGLGGPLTRLYRSAGDFDGDGYSRLLGGGDCDDWDETVHPGAVEIPDDGIDQNCIGGDATMQRSGDEVGFATVPATVPTQPNILLITIDTLRSDHVGAYGYDRPTTPAIDALAADGAVFLNSWAHAPSTRYSMPSLLTGRFPLAVHYDYSIRGWPGLLPKATTIAEILEKRGYHNGAILNYWYFDKQRRMDQGFDEYDNANKKLHMGRDPAKTRGSSSRQQSDKAIAFLERNQHRTFFLWVHYYDPHFTYERHDGTHEFGDRKIDLYDHEIRFTDDQIGRVIADLKQRGLYDKTIIVVAGDHGEGFGEHGIDLHGYHLYAAQTRVPLVIRVPGAKPVKPTMPVGHVDLLPTLANFAGASPAPEMQGRSLVAVLTGQADPDQDRWVYQQLSFENNNEQRAAASKQCHVIYYVSPQNSWELYRIDEDPEERRDAIDSPGACADARENLEAWYDQSEIPPDAAEALLNGRPTIAEPLNVELGDKLRLLSVDLPSGTVRPGDSVDVTYTWEALGQPAEGWKVFIHFEAPGGGRFLGDHEPARPFTWWRSGQFIRYTKTVTIPRNAGRGDYVMWMGLFRGNERRSVSSSNARVRVRDDRAAVGVVKVQR